jgi:hypothetical protein
MNRVLYNDMKSELEFYDEDNNLFYFSTTYLLDKAIGELTDDEYVQFVQLLTKFKLE